MTHFYDELRKKAHDLLKVHGLLDRKVKVKARALSTEEAIGNPEGDDFPLQKGKERLMQAEINGAKGQAFTDRYGDFEGRVKEILAMPLENNYRRAIFVATLNAGLRAVGGTDRTIHCKDKDPALCAQELVGYLRENYGAVRIGQVGFQPRMVEAVGASFPLRVLDLDPDNVGEKKYGILVEGSDSQDDVIDWADLLLVTGTVLVNGTIGDFLGNKPVLFYGTTISGAASLMGWERFCGRGR
jgi:hypothetical protein